MSLYLDDSIESKSFTENEVIFKEGDKVEGFFIVSKGSVVCVKNYNKRLTPIFYGREQDLIAQEFVLGSQDFYTYSAVALENTELVFISKQDVKDFLELKNDWIKDILMSLALKINNTSELIAEHRIINDNLNPYSDFDEIENKIREILKNA